MWIRMVCLDARNVAKCSRITCLSGNICWPSMDQRNTPANTVKESFRGKCNNICSFNRKSLSKLWVLFETCSHVTPAFASNITNEIYRKKWWCSHLTFAFSRRGQQWLKKNANSDGTCECTFSTKTLMGNLGSCIRILSNGISHTFLILQTRQAEVTYAEAFVAQRVYVPLVWSSIQTQRQTQGKV